MMDCAEAADFVISFTGDSVAIDRVNCLLNAVVAGYFAKGQPLSSYQRLFDSLSTHLGRRYPQRSHGLAEAPNSLSSHFRQRLYAMAGCRSPSNRTFRVTKKTGSISVVQEKPKMRSGVFRLRPPKISAGLVLQLQRPFCTTTN